MTFEIISIFTYWVVYLRGFSFRICDWFGANKTGQHNKLVRSNSSTRYSVAVALTFLLVIVFANCAFLRFSTLPRFVHSNVVIRRASQTWHLMCSFEQAYKVICSPYIPHFRNHSLYFAIWLWMKWEWIMVIMYLWENGRAAPSGLPCCVTLTNASQHQCGSLDFQVLID